MIWESLPCYTIEINIFRPVSPQLFGVLLFWQALKLHLDSVLLRKKMKRATKDTTDYSLSSRRISMATIPVSWVISNFSLKLFLTRSLLTIQPFTTTMPWLLRKSKTWKLVSIVTSHAKTSVTSFTTRPMNTTSHSRLWWDLVALEQTTARQMICPATKFCPREFTPKSE